MSIESNQILPDAILAEILRSGLGILGSRGSGKSTAAKVLVSEIIRNHPDVQCKIFDSCNNWVHSFENIYYQSINESTRFVYDKNEHILFDLDLLTMAENMNFIGKILLNAYMKQRKVKESTGYNDKRIVFVIEEAQNVLGSYSLMRRSGEIWLKLLSEGRNFGLSYILVGQRASNISTSALERIQGFLFSRMIADNDLQKIRRITGKESGITEEVRNLAIGEFIYFNGSSWYKFNPPEYKTTTKPHLWDMTQQERKIWEYKGGRRII